MSVNILRISDLLDSVRLSYLLQMSQHFLHDVSQFLIITFLYLLTYGINDNLPFVWMLHHVDSLSPLVVRFNTIEMAFKYDSKLLCENLFVSLLCCDVHH